MVRRIDPRHNTAPQVADEYFFSSAAFSMLRFDMTLEMCHHVITCHLFADPPPPQVMMPFMNSPLERYWNGLMSFCWMAEWVTGWLDTPFRLLGLLELKLTVSSND